MAEMTLLTLMPIRRAVSKSLDTARMAIPVLVWLMKITSAATRRMVSSGVTMVITFTFKLPTARVFLRKAISG